jgi:hypothetical protein
MARPDDPGSQAPGQQKTYVVTHPTDPSSPKTVTQQQWREDKMAKAGWVKPADVPDSELPPA